MLRWFDMIKRWFGKKPTSRLPMLSIPTDVQIIERDDERERT